MENVDRQEKAYGEKYDIVKAPLAYKNDFWSNLDKATEDVDGLIEIRGSYPNNPMIGYLKTSVCESDLSDCHKLAARIFWSIFVKPPPKK